MTTIADKIREFRDAAQWISEMPLLPGRHTEDSMLETFYNSVELVLSSDEEFGAVVEKFAEDTYNNDDVGDYGDPTFWDSLAKAVGVDIDEAPDAATPKC